MNLKKLSNHPFLQINISVFLWGFTAILGKLISIETILLVFLRMLIASSVFFLFPQTRLGLKNISKAQFRQLAVIGSFICLHWLCFYYSIKVFNSSSLALVCLGTGPMFVVWVEHWFFKSKKISFSEILISIIAIIGLIFVAFGNKEQVEFQWNGNYQIALFFGLMASLLAAIFTLMNKKYTKDISPFTTSFVELFTGALWLGMYLLFDFRILEIGQISSLDWSFILALSVLCTNIPFLLSIFALKKLNAFTVTLTVNLEPIYGMIFAAILFKELNHFSYLFFIGVFLILISVFIKPIYSLIQPSETI